MSAKKEQAQISSYARKLRENVKTILENYGEILKVAKVRLPIVCGLFQCTFNGEFSAVISYCCYVNVGIR